MLFFRLFCDWKGLGCVSGGDAMKSPRQTLWLCRRSEPGGLEAGLHDVEKDGLLKLLIPLRQPDCPAASHSAPGDAEEDGEKSWTRLELREAVPLLADLLATPVCAAGLGRLGVLAGVP